MMDKYRYKAEEIYLRETGLPFPITPTKEDVDRLMKIVKDLYQSEIYINRGNNINNPSLNMEVNNEIFESYKELNAHTKKIDDAKKVFWADLSNSLNEKFKAKNKKDVNTNAKSLDDLLVGDFTLFKIKKGKIDILYSYFF